MGMTKDYSLSFYNEKPAELQQSLENIKQATIRTDLSKEVKSNDEDKVQKIEEEKAVYVEEEK
jgi:hypothetical protein